MAKENNFHGLISQKIKNQNKTKQKNLESSEDEAQAI